MRYTYNVTCGNAKFECADVQEIVKQVNEHTGFPVLTEAMVYSQMTRPHRANKRMFSAGKIQIQRTRLPTKAELMAMAQVNTPHLSSFAA
jgi:hypothetical protein